MKPEIHNDEPGGCSVDESVTVLWLLWLLWCAAMGVPTPVSGDLLTLNAGKADIAGTEADL